MIKRSDFHYELPEKLIAQHPLQRRDASRLLVLDAATGQTRHEHFAHLPELLSPGDCLVANNSKVIPARLLGRRSDSGTPVEVLLLNRLSDKEWDTIVRPGRRVRPGHRLEFIPGRLTAEVMSLDDTGNRKIRFEYEGLWEQVLDEAGSLPLPPYIHEKLADPERYQTVYARFEGSAAAPTAGLHFTPDLIATLKKRGILWQELTLHVGLGTFRPVQAETVDEHTMHREFYQLTQATVDAIEATKRRGGKVIAVGTTSCRVLESVWQKYGMLKADSGWTDIFIYPGHEFGAIDGLLTNFHLPESTLIMLVSALAGRESVLAAYQEAIEKEYRFFSFGDAMLILPAPTRPQEDRHA